MTLRPATAETSISHYLEKGQQYKYTNKKSGTNNTRLERKKGGGEKTYRPID